jgi:transcriptional regulatory protein LevR
MGKTYQLKTIQDIVETIDENNKENFLKDFRIWINMVIKLKKQTKKLVLTRFEWIDDDKENYQVNIKVVKKI